MALSDYDKQVREAGYNYIPRTEFLLNPFKIPESKPIVDTETKGIPTLIPRDSGDGFNPYNTDMSTIRQDFNPYEARQAEEIYSRTFNPRSFDPSGQIKDAQVMYNKALQDINDPRPGAKGLNARTETFSGQPRLSQEVLDYYGEKILDNQERYRTQGQYVDPYDPKYSSMAEAQQFMNMNNPEYYGMPSYEEETGIPAAMRNYMQNSLIGKGLGAAKGFVENILPFNERAVLEDQARAAGIYTDDIGRIVTDDYNTAGGIMAGYNLNQIDADTFDKRRQTIMENMSDRINPETGKTFKQERLDLLDEAEAEILGARKKTKLVKKLRKDKKAADKKRKEDEAAAAAEEERKAAIIREREFAAQGRSDPNDPSRQGASGRRPGSGGQVDRVTSGPGRNVDDTGQAYDSGGREGFGYGLADGGRVYYMDGGLADLVDIYD